MNEIFEQPENCPACGFDFPPLTEEDKKGLAAAHAYSGVSPVTRKIILCFGCLEFLVRDDDGTWRPLTPGEFLELPPMICAKMVGTRNDVKRRLQNPKSGESSHSA